MNEKIFSMDYVVNKINSSKMGDLSYPVGSSSVVIPLIEKDGQTYILFEKRSELLKFQPGEICFPGGRIEGNESAIDAAIRECREELLINENDDTQIDIITSMRPMIGPSNSIVFPHVAKISNYDGAFSSSEVACILEYPINYLLNIKPSHDTINRTSIPSDTFPFELIPGGKDYSWGSRKLDMWFYETDGHIIWGFTARLLHIFLDIFRTI